MPLLWLFTIAWHRHKLPIASPDPAELPRQYESSQEYISHPDCVEPYAGTRHSPGNHGVRTRYERWRWRERWGWYGGKCCQLESVTWLLSQTWVANFTDWWLDMTWGKMTRKLTIELKSFGLTTIQLILFQINVAKFSLWQHDESDLLYIHDIWQIECCFYIFISYSIYSENTKNG